MDAAFTAEQSEIRRTLRAAFAKGVPPGPPGQDGSAPAAGAGPGHDPALWSRLAGGLGLPGLALEEKYGGVGCGTTELALAFEETGRALVPLPLFATSGLAAPLITALGTERQRAALLPGIADGSLTAALCVPGTALATALALTGGDPDGTWAGGGRAGGIQARPDGHGGWRLYGEAAQVLDGHSAGLLLVAAHTGGFTRGRALLFLVRGQDADGLRRTRWTALDETRPQARVQLRDTRAELLGDDPDAEVPAALAAIGRTAAALLAAEAVGAAEAALDRTVEHVKDRRQFGRAVGSFQAVKHRLADLYVRVQAARSAAYYAAWDPREGALALAQCLEALRTVTGEAIQLHGGIGFTWEHEAHLYFKRAASDELLFGPVHRLRARAAETADLFAPAPPAAAPLPVSVPAPADGSPRRAGSGPGPAGREAAGV
ncbi:acyl-CoA dehydrogenase family protein [Streptomyces sp. NPDC007883]|uniref:acyl-CoA dehydrogenase family protein n=1 Tax=Streptomyces sp. NPDC007883 TaxID=3155116 RepID=UPI0033EFA436